MRKGKTQHIKEELHSPKNRLSILHFTACSLHKVETMCRAWHIQTRLYTVHVSGSHHVTFKGKLLVLIEEKRQGKEGISVPVSSNQSRVRVAAAN